MTQASTNSSIEPQEKTLLRELVGTMDRQLSALAAQAGPDAAKAMADGLMVSWGEVVKLMALGPAPKTRACPRCGSVGMRDALRCGTCWSALTPPPSEASAIGAPGAATSLAG